MNDSKRTKTLRELLELSEELDTLSKHLKYQQDEMDSAKDKRTRLLYTGYVLESSLKTSNVKTKMEALLKGLND